METDKFTIEPMDNGFVVRVHKYGAPKSVVFKYDEFGDILALLIESYAPADRWTIVRGDQAMRHLDIYKPETDAETPQNKDETDD